jgi:hypothetical protein
MRCAALLFALLGGVACEPTRGADAPAAPSGPPALALSAEAVASAGIEVAAATPARREPELEAYGRVLDPTPIVAAIAEREATRAAAEASQRELARVIALAHGDQNASARDLETARAAAARAGSDYSAADARLLGALGATAREREDLASLERQLVRREVALVRVDAPAAGERPEPERGAQLSAYPAARGALETRYLGPASDTDPAVPGWSFLFLVSRDPPPAGSLVRARLSTATASLSGVTVPATALIRDERGAFAFVERVPGTYERRAVAAEALPDGRWFVASGIGEAERVVVAGAQQLLSAERFAAHGETGRE